MSKTLAERLPELPEPEIRIKQPATLTDHAHWRHGYTADQMHEYAARAVREAGVNDVADRVAKDTFNGRHATTNFPNAALTAAGRGGEGDKWPTVQARLRLAVEHGDAHGWYVARNELLGIIGSDYAATPQQPASGESHE